MEPTLYRKFQYTDLHGNNNKLWAVKVWPNGTLTTIWGRVGSTLQENTKDGDRYTAERLISSKLAKGYKEVELHIPKVAVMSKTATVGGELGSIVDTIFSEAGENIASYLATSVDALGQRQIDRGRHLLVQAQAAYKDYRRTSMSREWERVLVTVQQYYNTIPTILPARIDPDAVAMDFCKDFGETDDRLNQLEAAIATQVIQRVQPKSNYDVLGAKLRIVDKSEPVYTQIERKVRGTLMHGYGVTVRNIVEVNIDPEREAFDKETFGKSNIKLLFHGTRSQNIRHILRTGLIIPRASSNGSMLGRAIYFADMFSKSANYCSSLRAPYKFAFLADVALGNQYIAPDAKDFSQAPVGYHSVFGKAGHTRTWGSSTLRFNEFTVYRPSQQTIKYMVLFN